MASRLWSAAIFGFLLAVLGGGCDGRLAGPLEKADTVIYARRSLPDGYFVGYMVTDQKAIEKLVDAVRSDLNGGGPPIGSYYNLASGHVLVFCNRQKQEVVGVAKVLGNRFLIVGESPKHYAKDVVGVLQSSSWTQMPVSSLEEIRKVCPYAIVVDLNPEDWKTQ